MLRSTPLLRTSLVIVLGSMFFSACSDDDSFGSVPGQAGSTGSDEAAGAGGEPSSVGAAGRAGNAGNTNSAGSSSVAGDSSLAGSTSNAGAGDLAGAAGAGDLAGAAGEAGAGNVLAPLGPLPVTLGTAANYVVLAESKISNVPTSAITGNLGISPAAATYLTGFSMTRSGTSWSSPQVVGSLFAADDDLPTALILTTAVGDMLTAYTDAATRPTPDFSNLGAGSIGGLTLTPGLYRWASSVTIATDVTLAGAANDVWIFQITGDLQLSAAKAMTLAGKARAKNVFWQVAGLVNLGTAAHAEGILLSKTAITLGTGATVNGRLLAQTAVTLASSTVTAPAP